MDFVLYELLLSVLNMSIIASYVIMFVLVVRLLLKKAPKIFSYALWAVVLIRLLLPFSFESDIGLLPSNTEPIPQNIVHTEYPEVDLPFPAINEVINENLPQGEEQLVADPLEVPVVIGALVWSLGIAIMVMVSVVSYLKLRKRLIGVTPFEKNIYISDHIDSPFVMGFIKPKIYLPSNLSEIEREFVISHEQTHIKRLDHITRIIAFIALCIHWFNPLVWTAFILAGYDMETSCDEAVIKKMDVNNRADYSETLLKFATNRRMTLATPLAFGEGDTKGRVKNVMKYKKPMILVSVVAIIIVFSTMGFLLTNAKSGNTLLYGANYSVKSTIYQTNIDNSFENTLIYTISANHSLHTKTSFEDSFVEVGQFTPYDLTDSELKQYMLNEDAFTSISKPSGITDAYILRLENSEFYIALQTKSGETFLGYGFEDIGERNDPYSDDTALYWLISLETNFYEGHVDANFFSRSISDAIGIYADSFYHFTSENRMPGYMIVGFMADDNEQSQENMSDMGFAVFHTFDEKGYRLLDVNVYPDAAITNNGILFADVPAVVSETTTDENSFHVILSCNDDLAEVVRVLDDGTEEKVAVHGKHEMILFDWYSESDSKKTSIFFYDSNGNIIEN